MNKYSKRRNMKHIIWKTIYNINKTQKSSHEDMRGSGDKRVKSELHATTELLLTVS